MVALRLPSSEDLRRLRKMAGLTQKELAEKAGVSQSLIARIETGTVDPRLSTLRKIMAAITVAQEKKTARDIMHSPVITVNATDLVRKAVDLMKEHDVSQMPVLRDGRIIGSIQESTIVKRLVYSRKSEEVFSRPVQEVMEENFSTVSPSTSIEDVLALLSHGHPALLVLDHEKLVGIITKIDVISAVTRLKGT